MVDHGPSQRVNRAVSTGRLKRTAGSISDRETQRAVHDAISHHLELYWD